MEWETDQSTTSMSSLIYSKEIYPQEVMHKIFSNTVVGSLTFLFCNVQWWCWPPVWIPWYQWKFLLWRPWLYSNFWDLIVAIINIYKNKCKKKNQAFNWGVYETNSGLVQETDRKKLLRHSAALSIWRCWCRTSWSQNGSLFLPALTDTWFLQTLSVAVFLWKPYLLESWIRTLACILLSKWFSNSPGDG